MDGNTTLPGRSFAQARDVRRRLRGLRGQASFRIRKLVERGVARWLVIAFEIVVCLFIGILAGRSLAGNTSSMPLWALAIAGGVGALGFAVVALRDMVTVLTLLLVSSVTINYAISTGTQSPLNLTIMLVAALAGLWILRMVVEERRISLVPSALNVPLLAFLAVAVLSWALAPLVIDWRVSLPGNALFVQAGQFAMFALSAAAFFLVANHYPGERMLKVWTAIVVALGLLAIVPDLLRTGPHPFPYAIGAIHMWPFVLLTAQLLFNPALRQRHWQLLGWSIIGVWGYWMMFGPYVFNTKGKWMPALMGVGLLFLLRHFRVTAVLCLLGLAALFATGQVENIVSGELATGSLYRVEIWRDVVNMTSDSYLFGLGPANYMYYWPALGTTSRTAFNIYERHGSLWDLDVIAPPSHNMYVDLLAETGIIGLGLFLVFGLLALRSGMRLARRLQPGFLQAHVHGIVAGFGAMLVGSFWFADWLIPFVYNISINGFRHSVYTWLLLGTLVGIEHSIREDNEYTN